MLAYYRLLFFLPLAAAYIITFRLGSSLLVPFSTLGFGFQVTLVYLFRCSAIAKNNNSSSTRSDRSIATPRLPETDCARYPFSVTLAILGLTHDRENTIRNITSYKTSRKSDGSSELPWGRQLESREQESREHTNYMEESTAANSAPVTAATTNRGSCCRLRSIKPCCKQFFQSCLLRPIIVMMLQ